MGRSYDVVISARMASMRLPGKALLPLFGSESALEFLVRRLQKSTKLRKLALATTQNPEDQILAQKAQDLGLIVVCGSEKNLIARYTQAALALGSEYMVRVTADCPFLDGTILDEVLTQCESMTAFDIASTKTIFPVGLDFEVFSAQALLALQGGQSLSAEEQEHLTLHFYNHPERYRIMRFRYPAGWPPSAETFTLDTPEDLEKMRHWLELIPEPALAIPELLRQIAQIEP